MKTNFNPESTNKTINRVLTPGHRILAQDRYINNNTRQTGLNNNDLIIGVSGAGKTRSYVIPNILHSDESMIIVDTKNSLYRQLRSKLEQKGYHVWMLDVAHAEKSPMGYNPLRFIRRPRLPYSIEYNSQDIDMLSTYLCPIEDPRQPFWDYAARTYISIFIAYVLEALPEDEKHLGSVAKLQEYADTPAFNTLLNEWGLAYPDSYAVQKWNLYKNTSDAERTHASCLMIAGEKLGFFANKGIQDMFTNPNQIDFKEMSNHKTALFINVSDSDRSNDRFLNLLYTQALHELCDYADASPYGHLKVPVRFIMDDFASNAVIPDFDKIISVIRSREIYVSIILQSLTQLNSLYGDDRAKTIINNCDSCLYLGGQDVETARYISVKANKTVDNILNLPVNTAYLFVRGQKPEMLHKYCLEEDELYRRLQSSYYSSSYSASLY